MGRFGSRFRPRDLARVDASYFWHRRMSTRVLFRRPILRIAVVAVIALAGLSSMVGLAVAVSSTDNLVPTANYDHWCQNADVCKTDN